MSKTRRDAAPASSDSQYSDLIRPECSVRAPGEKCVGGGSEFPKGPPITGGQSVTDEKFLKSVEGLVDHASLRRLEALTIADMDRFIEWDSLFRRFQNIEQRYKIVGRLETRQLQEVRAISKEIVMTDDELLKTIKTLREHAGVRRQESLTAADVKAHKEWNYVFASFHRALSVF
jgi:hypothetical protein